MNTRKILKNKDVKLFSLVQIISHDGNMRKWFVHKNKIKNISSDHIIQICKMYDCNIINDKRENLRVFYNKKISPSVQC